MGAFLFVIFLLLALKAGGQRKVQKQSANVAATLFFIPLNQETENVGTSLLPLLQSIRLAVRSLLDTMSVALSANTTLMNLVAGIEATLARPQLDLGTMALPRTSASAMAAMLGRLEVKPTIIFQGGTSLNEAQVERAVKNGIDQALEELWIEIEQERSKEDL